MESLFNKLRYTADVLASDHSTVLLAAVAAGFEELSGRALELAQLHSSEVRVLFTVRPDVSITSSCYVNFEGALYAVDYLMDPGKAAPDANKGEVPRGALTEIYAHRIQEGTSAGNIPPGVLFVQQLDGSKTHIRLNSILSTNLPVSALADEAFFLSDTGQIAVWNGTAFVIIGAAATIDWGAITGKPSTFPPALPIAESGVTGLTADLSALSAGITSEAGTRLAADGVLTAAVSSEASTRATADTTLQTNITAEATTRASADTTLQTNINAKQNALGYTAEDAANKDISGTLGTSDTKYPSQKAVKTYVDSHSPVLSVAGKTGTVTLVESDIASLVSDLAGKQASLGFTAENVANKDANSGYAGLDASGKVLTTKGGVAACTVSGEGYWIPEPYSESLVGKGFSTNLAIATTANRVYMAQVVLKHRQKISFMSFACGSGAGVTTGNNFGAAIYNHDGSARLATINVAGVVAINALVRTAIAETSVTLDPGVYWVAWVCTLTTTTMNALQNNANGFLGNAAGSTIRWGHSTASNASTAGSLPSSLVLPTTFLAQNCPIIFCEP